jgi:hypothetical protein
VPRSRKYFLPFLVVGAHSVTQVIPGVVDALHRDRNEYFDACGVVVEGSELPADLFARRRLLQQLLCQLLPFSRPCGQLLRQPVILRLSSLHPYAGLTYLRVDMVRGNGHTPTEQTLQPLVTPGSLERDFFAIPRAHLFVLALLFIHRYLSSRLPCLINFSANAASAASDLPSDS